MPRYTEVIIVIDINDRPMFGEQVEDAMKQGYVFHGDPIATNENYVQFMVKQDLKIHIESGGDVREYMRELSRTRQLLAEKQKERTTNATGDETKVEIPFG